MLELLTSGGWVMVPLLIFAVLATAICLERTWTLRRSEVLPHGIVQEIEDVGRHISHDLNRFLPTLGSIASLSPLLGLLGTVIGMIQMFLTILTTGVGDANQLAGGIGQALISTAAGLCVAIPALMLHRYFRGKVAGYVVEMEKVAMNLLDVLEARQAA